MPLRQVLIAVGEPLVDVLAAPRGFDVGVRDVVIVDPEEDTGSLRVVVSSSAPLSDVTAQACEQR